MDRISADGAFAAVRPTFMLPAVGTALYGGALAPRFDVVPAVVHGVAVAVALLVAHLRDGYVDGHVRGEESPALPADAMRRGIRVGVVGFIAGCALLWVVSGPVAPLLTLPLAGLALLHAPYLDTHPVTVTADYPAGIGLAILGGYAAQTGTVAPSVVAIATLFVLLLAGIKVAIDRLDAPFDRSIGKRTLPVLLGPERANALAVGVFAATISLLVAFEVVGLVPPSALLACVVPAACALAISASDPRTTVRLQMGLTYLFAAVLFVAVCKTDCGGWRVGEQLLFSDIERLSSISGTPY